MDLFIKKGRIISAIENTSIPLLYYFLAFFSFIIFENFLEIFSDPGFVSFKLFHFAHQLSILANASIAIHVMHTSLWWIAVILFAPIVFTFITRENIDKTLRAALSFSWLILLTPIADLIGSKGEGFNIHYVSLENIADLLYFPAQLTPGENLTVIAVGILVFSYCFIKTRKIIKAIAGTLLVGLGVLLAFTMPTIMRILAHLFNIGLDSITPVLVTRCLVFAIFIESVLIFGLRNKSGLISILKSMGGFKTLHFILMFVLGILLARAHIGRFILVNIGSFLLTIISFSLIWATANIISSWKETSLLTSSEGKTAIVLFLTACICALSVNFTTLYFVLVLMSACITYLLAPMSLKRFPFLSKLLISFSLLLLVILGWLFAGGEILGFPQIFSLYFLVFITLCLNFVDLKDYSFDKETGLITLPVELGEERARFLIGFSFVISYIATPWLFLEKMMFFPAAILGLAQFYLINRKKYKEEHVFLTHILSLIALLIWLNFFRVPV